MLAMSTSASFHHGDLKATLANSAARLIETAGVEALSLRAVAREAGVSTAAPYRHYASKEALLAEVARQGFERLHDDLVAAGAGLAAGPDFLAQGLGYIRFARAHPALYRLMFGGFADKSRFQGLTEASDRLFAVLEDRVSKGEGRQRAARAIGCWAFVHGLAMLAIDDQLRLHLPGADDADLVEILRPLMSAYIGDRHPTASSL